MTTRLFGVGDSTPLQKGARFQRWWSRAPLILVMLVVFVVATGLVLDLLRVGHGLFGLTEYDDGVYIGATMHFVAGQLPYRDFVLVQPPGITLLLAPVALIVGHGSPDDVMAVARVLTAVVAGINAVLIVWILHRRSLLAAFVAGLLFAIYPPGYNSDHTLMLEPYMALFCLIGIAIAFRNGEPASDRRLFIAGILIGFAGAIKLLAVAIAVAFVVVFAWRNRRALRPLLFGMLIGFVVPCLPFFIGAPHGFIHDVFTSQLSRNTGVPTPLDERIAAAVGLTFSTSPQNLPLGPDSPWPWFVGALMSFAVFIGVVIPACLRRASTFTWFAIVAALTSFGIVLIPQQFFTHYAYLAGIFIAIVLGCVVANVTEVLTRWRERSLSREKHSRAPTGIAALHPSVGLRVTGALTVIIVSLGAFGVLHSETKYLTVKTLTYGDPIKSLDKAIPAGSCVISDAESLLVVANRVDVSSNCPVMVDSTGTWLTYAPKYPPQRNRREPKDPALVALWKGLLAKVEYATFAGDKAFRTPFTPALSQWFNDNFAVVPGAAPITFKRRPHPINNAASTPGIVP